MALPSTTRSLAKILSEAGPAQCRGSTISDEQLVSQVLVDRVGRATALSHRKGKTRLWPLNHQLRSEVLLMSPQCSARPSGRLLSPSGATSSTEVVGR